MNLPIFTRLEQPIGTGLTIPRMNTQSKTASDSLHPSRVIPGFQRMTSIGGFFDPMNQQYPWDISHIKPAIDSEEGKRAMALKCQNSPKMQGTSSKYRGVSWNKTALRWLAQIRIPGKRTQVRVGSFIKEEDAAEAYNIAAKAIHGTDAFQNEIQPTTQSK